MRLEKMEIRRRRRRRGQEMDGREMLVQGMVVNEKK